MFTVRVFVHTSFNLAQNAVKLTQVASHSIHGRLQPGKALAGIDQARTTKTKDDTEGMSKERNSSFVIVAPVL